MKKCKVSVYITNHNYGKYIQKCIESVLSQNFQDFELIIIDDGSTDDSKEIINQYETNKKVFIVYQKRKGLNVSNNVAIRQSRGEYIIRLDADDWLAKNALGVLSKYLDKQKNRALVFPDYYEVDEEGKIIKRIKRHNFDKVSLLDRPAHGACTMIRKKYLKEIGMYDESFSCQDGYDIWIRLIHKFKVGNINKPLFFYRRHSENLTNNNNRIFNTRSLITKKFIKKTYKKKFTTLAIIPVRGKAINLDSVALKKLKKKPLITWTIENALNSKNINRVIVTSPDEKLIKFLKDKYGKKIECIKRDRKLGALNTNLHKTFLDAINKVKHKFKSINAIMELSIRNPFFSSDNMDHAIDNMRLFGTDMVLGVSEDDDEFLQHKGSGLKPLNKSDILRLERDSLYRKSGGFDLIDYKCFLKKKNIYSNIKIGHIMLDERNSFSLKNEISWKIAEKIF